LVDVLAGKTRHFMEEDQTSDEEETFAVRHFFALKSGVRKEYEIVARGSDQDIGGRHNVW
jgi:hypothetical protein